MRRKEEADQIFKGLAPKIQLLEEQVVAARQAVQRDEGVRDDIAAELYNMRTQAEGTEMKLNDCIQQKQDMNHEMETARLQIQMSKEHDATSKEVLHQLQKTMEGQEAVTNAALNELKGVQERLIGVRKEEQEVDLTLRALEDRIAASSQERILLQKDLDVIVELEACDEEAKQIKRHLEEEREGRQLLEAEIEQQQKRVDAQKTCIDNAVNATNDLRDQYHVLSSAQEAAQSELLELETVAQGLEEQKISLERRLDEIMYELDKSATKITPVQKAKEAEQEIRDTREILRAAQADREEASRAMNELQCAVEKAGVEGGPVAVDFEV